MAALRYGHIFIAVCIFLAIFIFSDAASRRCYQCVDSEGTGDCQDAGALLNITDDDYIEMKGKTDEDVWKRNQFYKECANANETYCMIETYETGGNYLSYHRDCSDGEIFSHSGTTLKLPLLQGLLPNNQTTCTYVSSAKTHICIRLCDSDMCNGPIPVVDVCRNLENVTVTDEFGNNHTCTTSAMSPLHHRVATFVYLIALSLAYRYNHGF